MRGSIACLDGLHSHTTRMRLPVDPRHAWMAHRRDIESSGGTSPSVEGLPRGGGRGRQREGPTRLRSIVGTRETRVASRDKKGCLLAALFFIWRREGLSGASMHPTLPRYALQGQPTAVRFCSCRTVEPRRGSHPPHQRCRSLQQPPASPERWPKKAAQWAAFFFIWRRGFEPRGAINACLISSQVHSTTLPPLRVVPGGPGTRIIRGSEADDK